MNKFSFIIKVNNPCAENWYEMTPVDRGRHCLACQKTVIDFIVLTDREIINFFKENKGNATCGHFLSSQLNHELIETKLTPTFSSTLLKRTAAALLFFQTIANTAWTQTAKPKTTQQGKIPAKPDDNRVIKGKVMDYVTKEPLSAMKVQIVGAGLVAYTDKYGRFQLALPDSFRLKTFKLHAIYPETESEPQGTVILDVDINLDSFLLTTEVMFYRYQQENLNKINISSYKQPIPLITKGEFIVVPRTEVIDLVKKRTFWQRITSPFHKKEKND